MLCYATGWLFTILRPQAHLNYNTMKAATPLILNPEAARYLWQAWYLLECVFSTFTVRNQQGFQLLTTFTF